MPLKLPKALIRRRSSGNILDNVEEPPVEHSFRVLDRHEVEDHAFSGGLDLKKKNARWALGSPVYDKDDYLQEHDLSHRYGGQNNASASTFGTSSVRLSNGSTMPSSLESRDPPRDDLFFNERPTAFPPLRSSTPQPQKHKSAFGNWTAGKVFQSKAKIHTLQDDLLDNTRVKDNATYTAVTDQAPTAHDWEVRQRRRSNAQPVGDLGEALKDLANRNKGGRNITPNSTQLTGAESELTRSVLIRRSMDNDVALRQSHKAQDLYKTNSWDTDESRAFLSAPVQSLTVMNDDEFTQVDNTTQIVMDALYAREMLDEEHSDNLHRDNTVEDQQVLNSHVEAENLEHETIRSAQAHRSQNSTVTAQMPPLNHRTSTFMGITNRAMTPAQFEQYKKEKERVRVDDDRSVTSEESVTYDDEDETEREKQMVRQRRKQEAAMAVYRHQMMKVTGESPSAPIRSHLGRPMSSMPNLAGKLEEKDGKSSDEDDDEDVPLGILQAHGFPNKDRAPVRLSTASTSNLANRLSSYPAPAGSTRNDPCAGGGGSMPAFARNLPLDPYIGANLVKTGDRESLGFSHTVTDFSTPVNLAHRRQSHMIPQQLSSRPSSGIGLPPGGLIGVIADEEYARAVRSRSPMRNGPLLSPQPLAPHPRFQPPSPSPDGSYGPQSYLVPLHSPMSATEQSQVQVNNSMAQVMQLQMQWMQQMMAMQGIPPQPIPSFPILDQSQPPLAIPTSAPRPTSIGVLTPSSTRPAPSPQAAHGRGTSTLSGPLKERSDYFGLQSHTKPCAASITPSERSTIGQPSRYVTTSTPHTNRAGATLTSSTPVTMNRENRQTTAKAKAKHTPNPPTRPSAAKTKAITTSTAAPNEDEDEEDEEGWRQMKREREERRRKRQEGRRVESAVEVLGVADGNVGV